MLQLIHQRLMPAVEENQWIEVRRMITLSIAQLVHIIMDTAYQGYSLLGIQPRDTEHH